MFETTLGRVVGGESLSVGQMTEAIDAIMRGQVDDARIGLFLTALRAKGETVEELAGAATAMRSHMTPIRTSRPGVLDTCGTGGDGSGTFNISTAAALVTAAAGVPVAKHGNRSITSRSGSADVLAALGVNINASVPVVEACLDRVGICFCFGPLLHPSMRQVAEVRKRLGVPTIFNLLGPLCNPASAPFQVLGVGRRELARLLAAALQMLGTTRAIVVTGGDGLDEVTLNGPTHVIEVRAAGSAAALATAESSPLRELAWTAADFGFEPRELTGIQAASPEESAALIRTVLAGQRGTARDIVVANVSAALWTAGRAGSLSEGARLAAEAIDGGATEETLAKLVETSHGTPA